MISDEIAMNAACIFEHTVKILNGRMNEGIMNLSISNNENGKLDAALFVPIVVNCSFACELYMKSMLPNKIIKHELDILFFKLDSNIQQEVQNNIVIKMKKILPTYNDKDFKNDLQKI